jgi:uncharacterized membrane protein
MKAKILSQKKERDRIVWRSHEPGRLETFSDAVFAFALTLIVVSVEVPKSFNELSVLLKDTISFALCFIILFSIWYNQNLFFRRYGLNDGYTICLNGILLFVSLIYVYPLKFLTSLINNDTYLENGKVLQRLTQAQGPLLMIIYGIGFVVIYLLFFLMYRTAIKRADELDLTERELFETKTATYINLLVAIIGMISILSAIILPVSVSGISGFVYFLMGPVYSVWYAYRGKRSRLLFG